MKCPYCNYEHGWSNEQSNVIEGVKGDFYALPIKLEKTDSFYVDRKDLYACPDCLKVFVN